MMGCCLGGGVQQRQMAASTPSAAHSDVPRPCRYTMCRLLLHDIECETIDATLTVLLRQHINQARSDHS